MSEHKVYDPAAKRRAGALWSVFSAGMIAALAFPLYWFWSKISARTDVLFLIAGLFAWAAWNWWKLSSSVAQRIKQLPENRA